MRRGVIREIFKHSVCQVYRQRRTTKGCAASTPKYRTVVDKTMPSANPWLAPAPSTSSTNKKIRHFCNKICAQFYRGFVSSFLTKKKKRKKRKVLANQIHEIIKCNKGLLGDIYQKKYESQWYNCRRMVACTYESLPKHRNLNKYLSENVKVTQDRIVYVEICIMDFGHATKIGFTVYTIFISSIKIL